jgi:Flp pilus assembly pilin Flp
MNRAPHVFKALVGWFWVDFERAATAIEYGLIASRNSLALVVGYLGKFKRPVQRQPRQEYGIEPMRVLAERERCRQRSAPRRYSE